MAGRGVGELPGGRIDRDADGCGHLVLVHVPHEAPHDRPRGDVIVGIRAERAAQLAHERRCRDAAPSDVADANVHDPVGSLHDVVPVAADLEAGAARLITGRRVDGRDLRYLRE